jgi:transposase
MRLHANAALSWSGRRLLCDRVLGEGWTLTAAAAAAGVSVRCARKWVSRYKIEGEQGLLDRSSAPRHVANRTSPDRVAVIVSLRRLRMAAAEIAETLAMPLSTVSVVLKRSGMGRLGRIGLEQPVRYERSRRPASSSTSMSRSSVGSRVVPANGSAAEFPAATGRGAPTAAAAGAARSAGSSSTSPSTTTAGSPTPKCSAMRRPRPRSASCNERSPSSPATASASKASSLTTAAPTSRPCTHSRAARSASGTCAHDHAAHRQPAWVLHLVDQTGRTSGRANIRSTCQPWLTAWSASGRGAVRCGDRTCRRRNCSQSRRLRIRSARGPHSQSSRHLPRAPGRLPRRLEAGGVSASCPRARGARILRRPTSARLLRATSTCDSNFQSGSAETAICVSNDQRAAQSGSSVVPPTIRSLDRSTERARSAESVMVTRRVERRRRELRNPFAPSYGESSSSQPNSNDSPQEAAS